MSKKNINFIQGSGFLAKAFKKKLPFFKKNKIILYVAGISNSLENKNKEFKREFKRIEEFIKSNNKKIVYISTCSIFDKSRNHAYVKNKIKIEKLIKLKVKKYIIIRLPELVGQNKNPNTLVNFFYNKIIKKKKFNLWINAKRNLLDIEDVVKMTIYYVNIYKNKNKVINLLNTKFYYASEVLENLEKITRKKAVFNKKKIKSYKFKIKNELKSKAIRDLGLRFNKSYLNHILKKYYNK